MYTREQLIALHDNFLDPSAYRWPELTPSRT